MPLEIIYEDENFLAVNKPAGLLVHAIANSSVREMTLADWAVSKRPEIATVGDDPINRPGIVHRLDKDTSGVILIARKQEYFEYLKSLFASHKIKKTYLAVVFGRFPDRSGRIEKPIGIISGSLRRSTRSEKMQKTAVTEYRIKKEMKSGGEFFSGVEVMPQTGRTHQIRVHFASVNHPLVGDPIYGKKNQPEWAQGLMLHALSLEFSIAAGRSIRIEAEPPKEFERFFSV